MSLEDVERIMDETQEAVEYQRVSPSLLHAQSEELYRQALFSIHTQTHTKDVHTCHCILLYMYVVPVNIMENVYVVFV